MSNHQAGPSTTAFIGTLCLIGAWLLMPGPDSYWQTWMMSGFLALIGTSSLVGVMLRVRPSPSPFPSFLGKVLWFFRPRSWMIALAVVLIAAWAFGTPHLRWQYHLQYGDTWCDYIGITGAQRIQFSEPHCGIVMLLKPQGK